MAVGRCLLAAGAMVLGVLVAAPACSPPAGGGGTGVASAPATADPTGTRPATATPAQPHPSPTAVPSSLATAVPPGGGGQSTAPPPATPAPVPPPPVAPPAPPDDPGAPGHGSRPAFRASVSAVTAAELSASWRPGCPVPVAGLRAVDALHVGYDGAAHEGRIVVAAAVADDVVAILADLYAIGFPVERMTPVEAYGGDDDASMAANNTSAFNCRAVTGGSSWSEHSYGRAIDVNPLVNPYVAGTLVLPSAGRAYADRSGDAPGMIHAGDAVVRAFAARGWVWGGTWSSPKDYQHFSTSGR